jgi:hypothetical protein
MPLSGEAGGQGNGVLLGNAGVDEALAEGPRDAFQGHVPEIAGDEHQIASPLE